MLAKWILPAIFALSMGLIGSPASAQSSGCEVAGSYWLAGRVPGATGSYKGEAKISAKGGGCSMKWYPPNDSEGSGTYVNGVLTVYFTFAKGGGSGVVQYYLQPNGELRGEWWMNNSPSNRGIEVLSRYGTPQLAPAPAPAAPSYSSPAPSASQGAGWIFHDTDSRGVSDYYQLLGASPENPAYRRVRVRLEFPSQQQASGLSFRSTLTVTDVDCAANRHLIISETVYEGANLSLNAFTLPPERRWEAAGNKSQYWISAACR